MPKGKKRVEQIAPLRVFVGTSPGGEDAEACIVFEHTLRRASSVPLDIYYMALSRQEGALTHGWRTAGWTTPWTGLRWAVPEMCEWSGRAVYFDCTTIVRGDVADLARAEFPAGSSVLVRREGSRVLTGCLVWECARAKKWLPSITDMRIDPAAHQRNCATLASRRSLMGDLPAGWGLRDIDFSREPAIVTGSVNCANTYMYPHARHALRRLRPEGRTHWFTGTRVPHFCSRLTQLFDEEYGDATTAGYVPSGYALDANYGDYGLVTGTDDKRRAS